MTIKHSSKKRAKSKPVKPHKDFPLFAHASGQWAKKIKGKLAYFGRWEDPAAALELWRTHKDGLLAGESLRDLIQDHNPDALTVADLCNQFLESKERRVKSGELKQRTFDDYHSTAKQVTNELGRNRAVEKLRPKDFAALRDTFAKDCNLKTLEGRIARSRAIFNHANKNGLLDVPLPKLWGTEFQKPSKTALQKLSNENGEKLFSPAEIKALLDVADSQLKAMILLGVNCGFGNTDVSLLRLSHIDFDAGFISLPRSKTGKLRRCPLWPQTVKALSVAIAKRTTAKDKADAELVFITKYGNAWTPTRTKHPLSWAFVKAKKAAGVSGRNKGFYTLRHVFQTIGDEARDNVATSAIMGHVDGSIASHYRERISDERLKTVTDHVHGWLFAE